MSFVDRFFEDGNINTIIAPPKEGKTNFAVYLGFNAIRCGYTVLSNIAFFKPKNIPTAIERGWLHDIKFKEIPKKFKYIPLASDLILEASKDDKNIVIIDEGGISISSSRALSDAVVQFKFLGYSIRKIGACLIIISQTKSSIVPVLRKELVDYEVHIIKNKDGSRDAEFLKSRRFFNQEKRDYDVAFHRFDYRHNIPYTPIAYDTRHPGGFTWNINLQKFYETIAQSGYDSVEIREHIPQIIKNMVADKKIDLLMKEREFMRTGKAAILLNVTTQTIRNWIEEGKLNAIKDDQNNFLLSRTEIKKYGINQGLI